MYLSKSRRGSGATCAPTPAPYSHPGRAFGVSPATILNVPAISHEPVDQQPLAQTPSDVPASGSRRREILCRPSELQSVEDPGHLHFVALEAERRAQVDRTDDCRAFLQYFHRPLSRTQELASRKAPTSLSEALSPQLDGLDTGTRSSTAALQAGRPRAASRRGG